MLMFIQMIQLLTELRRKKRKNHCYSYFFIKIIITTYVSRIGMFGFVEVAFPLPSPHQKMVWLLATTVPVSYERKANRRFDRTVLSIPNKKTNFHKHCDLPVKMNLTA